MTSAVSIALQWQRATAITPQAPQLPCTTFGVPPAWQRAPQQPTLQQHWQLLHAALSSRGGGGGSGPWVQVQAPSCPVLFPPCPVASCAAATDGTSRCDLAQLQTNSRAPSPTRNVYTIAPLLASCLGFVRDLKL